VKDDIDARLHDLRTAVEEARSMPMSSSVMINRAEFLDLLGALEAAIDQTLSQATEVVGDREAVLAEGITQAEEIVRAAEMERDVLVSETDVFRLAEARAAEITESARKAAEELQAETDQYVEEKLANFELTLERTLELVRRGRAKLSGGHSAGLGDDSDVDAISLPDHLER
jgi:cell division septum initiation protein DivIVA